MTVIMSSLYKSDFSLWLEQTAQLLKSKRFNELDLDNLVEEIEALNRSEKREVESRLEVLLMHLLKWHYQPEHQFRSWQATIREQRRQILRLLKDSPSLKGHLSQEFDACYAIAREKASDETTIFLENFPAQCPYVIADVLNPDFLPN
jgi:Domain of unknown function DUF29